MKKRYVPVLVVIPVLTLAVLAVIFLPSAGANSNANKIGKQAGQPSASLHPSGFVQSPSGTLYWTTGPASDAQAGTSFGELLKSTPDGQWQSLHHFLGVDGDGPTGSLLLAADGFIYGVTSSGGPDAAGVIYRIGQDGSGFKLIHSFNVADGARPAAGLVQDTGGTLYGVASQGGEGKGVIFAVSPSGNFSVLHSFSKRQGFAPESELLLGNDGLLYGAARRGGWQGEGTIYKVGINGSGFKVIHNFGPSEGSHPGALLQTSQGLIIGLTEAGGLQGEGTLFQLYPDGSGFQTIHDFAGFNDQSPDDSDGAAPASLIDGQDGYLYGTTSRGGRYNVGTIFKLDPITYQVTVLFSYTATSSDPVKTILASANGLVVPSLSDNTVTLQSVTALTPRNQQSGFVTPQATVTVTNNMDTGAGSLRTVISGAASGSTIAFDPSLNDQTIALTSGEILINKNLTITGPGSAHLTISGSDSSRVFFISSGTVSITGLTISHGMAKGGDGGNTQKGGGGGGGAGMGGGIFVTTGTIALTDVNFDHNQVTGGAGGSDSLTDGSLGGGGGGGTAPGSTGNGANAPGAGGGNGGGSGNLGGAIGTGGTSAPTSGSNSGLGAGAGGGGGRTGGGGANGGAAGLYGGGGGAGAGTAGGTAGAGGYGGGGGGGGLGLTAQAGRGGLGGTFGGGGQDNSGSGSTVGAGGGGAGMGGALFIAAGSITINSGSYTNNTSTHGSSVGNMGQGKGGALFFKTGVTAKLGAGQVSFGSNSATEAGSTSTDNNNVWGAFSCNGTWTPSINAPTSVCPNSTGNTASGPDGAATYSWSITGGTITSGASSQTVTFTAGASGTVMLTLNVTDASGCTGSNSISVTIGGSVSISPTTLSDGTAGTAYTSVQFMPNGATFSYTGTLPTGMTLSSSGLLSGTPTQTGSFPIDITATQGGCSGSQSVTLQVDCPTITINQSSLSAGTAGVSYSSVSFTQTGGVGTITFTESGTLPTGMTFSSGTLSGTPTQTGTFPITITATDSNSCTGTHDYSLVVSCPTVTITTPSIPAGVTGMMYGPVSFSQTGGVGTITYTESGTLPNGISFTSGSLSGTPTQTGSFPITITATDQNGCFGTHGYTLVVSCATISVGPMSLGSGTAGVPYSSVTFSQMGGSGTITFGESGTLPTGMSFLSGVLSGTPTQTGSFPIMITATDQNGCMGSHGYTLVINCPTITVMPVSIPAGMQGIPYTPTQFTQTGGVGTITFSTSSTLPTGISLSSGGLLSGTPMQGGTYTIVVVATDSNGCTGSRSVILSLTGLDKCLKDNTNGNFIQFNSTTGNYLFTVCGPNGFTLSGQGTVTIVNSVINIVDNKSDRRLTIQYVSNSHTGTVTLIKTPAPGISTRYTITDTNPNPVCACNG